MLNLLKRKDRYWVKKEYLMRVAVVLFSFVSVSLIILGAILFSFYAVVESNVKVAENDLNKIKDSTNNKHIDDLLDINNVVDQKISQFYSYQFNQSDIVERVVRVEDEVEGVESSLIDVSVKEGDESVYAEIEIRGLAETRDDLVAYQSSMKDNEFFDSVDIPLGSFAKNNNISFTAKIKTVDLNNYFENYEQ